MEQQNAALDYILTFCTLFVFLHVAVRTIRFSDNESTVAYRVELSTAARPTSSLSNDSVSFPDEKFISLCPANLDNRRLGNQLFNFAAMLYVAELTGRRIIMPRSYVRRGGNHSWIDRWFEVPVVELVDEVVPRLCPCRNVTERRGLAFERSLRRTVLRSSHFKTLLTCGFFQSWRYAAGRDGGLSLRRQLRWRPKVISAVRRFAADHHPPGCNSTTKYTRIGVHVRVGDLLDRRKLAFGYTIPGRSYFRRAIAFFMRHHGRNTTGVLQFVVTSDDLGWARTHLRLGHIVARYGSSADLVYSSSTDAGLDLARLSSCDGVIMSTGTYGWWAGWLAAGTTVYHRRWPRRGSPLDAVFERRDFFPPRWIDL